MRRITGLDAQPNQVFRMPHEDGRIRFRLQYRPRVQNWYISIRQNDFRINGLRVVVSPNMLKQYENLIGFGLLCGGAEPFLINDFDSGRVSLYLLEDGDFDTLNDFAFPSREVILDLREDNG